MSTPSQIAAVERVIEQIGQDARSGSALVLKSADYRAFPPGALKDRLTAIIGTAAGGSMIQDWRLTAEDWLKGLCPRVQGAEKRTSRKVDEKHVVIDMVRSLGVLVAKVRPEKLRSAAILIESGKTGRKIDLAIFLALNDFIGLYDGWRYCRAADHGGIIIRNGSGETHCLEGVQPFSTSKDAIDPVLKLLLPETSISSSFGAGRSRIRADVTYASRRGEAYITKAVVPGSNDPAAEAAARCGAILRLLADMSAERRRFAGEASKKPAPGPNTQRSRSRSSKSPNSRWSVRS